MKSLKKRRWKSTRTKESDSIYSVGKDSSRYYSDKTTSAATEKTKELRHGRNLEGSVGDMLPISEQPMMLSIW